MAGDMRLGIWLLCPFWWVMSPRFHLTAVRPKLFFVDSGGCGDSSNDPNFRMGPVGVALQGGVWTVREGRRFADAHCFLPRGGRTCPKLNLSWEILDIREGLEIVQNRSLSKPTAFHARREKSMCSTESLRLDSTFVFCAVRQRFCLHFPRCFVKKRQRERAREAKKPFGWLFRNLWWTFVSSGRPWCGGEDVEPGWPLLRLYVCGSARQVPGDIYTAMKEAPSWCLQLLDPEGKPFTKRHSFMFFQRRGAGIVLDSLDSRHFEVSVDDPSISIKSGDDGTSTLWRRRRRSNFVEFEDGGTSLVLTFLSRGWKKDEKRCVYI